MIHPTAIISSKAQIGENVSIGPYTIIHDNVHIAENTLIESHCELGTPNKLAEGIPLRIGPNSHIRSYSIFYEGSQFGENLVTGHRVTVREKTKAGKNLQIGTLSDIQGHCTFGDYTRLHSNVHIGQHTQIGDFVWLFPYSVLTNDPRPPSNFHIGCTIEDFAVIAVNAVILPGIKIRFGCLIGAHSLVDRDTEPEYLYAGSPAKKICLVSNLKLKDGSNKPAYPWVHHFSRGYPQDLTTRWQHSRKKFLET